MTGVVAGPHDLSVRELALAIGLLLQEAERPEDWASAMATAYLFRTELDRRQGECLRAGSRRPRQPDGPA